MAIIPQIFNDAVVAIGALDQNGEKKWLATGFIVARKNENGGYNTFLVTNKHVLECGLSELLLRFNVAGKIDAKDYPIALFDKEENRVYSTHPSADVASVLLNASVLSADLGNVSAFVLDQLALTREQMIENEVVEGTIVYTLGFPSGLVGVDSKVPLCRMGCISKIQEPVNGQGYLLDIQNFPGSSGSPVINRIESNFLKGTKQFNSTRLIGIIASYIPYIEELVSKKTGKTMQVLQENSGIAVAYDVNSIEETVELEFQRVKALEKKVTANSVDPTVEEPQDESSDSQKN